MIQILLDRVQLATVRRHALSRHVAVLENLLMVCGRVASMLALAADLLEIVGLINRRTPIARQSFMLSRRQTATRKMLWLLLRICQR